MRIRTVSGGVDTEEITGPVLPHEHLLINLRQEYRGPGLVTNTDLVEREAAEFARLGGSVVVDVTPAELTVGTFGPRQRAMNGDLDMNRVTGSRSPANVEALADIAQSTGVHVVAGTGHYRDPHLDRAWFDRNEASAIADFMVRDIEEGFPGTGVRAGIIGEIGSDTWHISAAEERSFRAAARAQLRTGVALTTHAARWPTGFKQLDILRSEGVEPNHVIIGHVDTVTDSDYALELARAGVWVQLDTFYYCRVGGQIVQHEFDRRIDLIMSLVRAGHADRILLSHDGCLTSHARVAGGAGLVFLIDHVVDALKAKGLDDDLITTFMRDNPLRAIATG